jgi:hypothetical protein
MHLNNGLNSLCTKHSKTRLCTFQSIKKQDYTTYEAYKNWVLHLTKRSKTGLRNLRSTQKLGFKTICQFGIALCYTTNVFITQRNDRSLCQVNILQRQKRNPQGHVFLTMGFRKLKSYELDSVQDILWQESTIIDHNNWLLILSKGVSKLAVYTFHKILMPIVIWHLVYYKAIWYILLL